MKKFLQKSINTIYSCGNMPFRGKKERQKKMTTFLKLSSFSVLNHFLAIFLPGRLSLHAFRLRMDWGAGCSHRGGQPCPAEKNRPATVQTTEGAAMVVLPEHHITILVHFHQANHHCMRSDFTPQTTFTLGAPLKNCCRNALQQFDVRIYFA